LLKTKTKSRLNMPSTEIRSISKRLIVSILPNRKLNSSTLKPPARLIIINPVLKPTARITAVAESDSAKPLLFMLDIRITEIIETINAVYRGLTFKKSPIAMPPKLTCAIPSPIIDCLRRITNKPIREQAKALMLPPIRAFWKKTYPRRLNNRSNILE
jgi:hypothetical protein